MSLSTYRRHRQRDLECRIIEVMAEEPDTWFYGLDLERAVHLRSGRFYPALGRLERAGAVEPKWEDDEAKHPRRMYRLRPPTATVTLDGEERGVELSYVGLGPDDLHAWVPVEPVMVGGALEVTLSAHHVPGGCAVGVGMYGSLKEDL